MDLHAIIAKNILGEKVLDMGFAQGPNFKIESKFLYGVDIQKVEKPDNYLEIRCTNLNKDGIPYENEFFDTVIMADIIEHVENPSHVLRECNRVLKSGGRLIVSTPQANYWYDFLKNLIFSSFRINLDRDPGSHLSNWTILDFKRLLKKNSFELEKLLGGFIHLPFGVNIPVSPFPILGWQAIYICRKVDDPKLWVYTKDSSGKHFLINE